MKSIVPGSGGTKVTQILGNGASVNTPGKTEEIQGHLQGSGMHQGKKQTQGFSGGGMYKLGIEDE